jgi:hypothetical protein
VPAGEVTETGPLDAPDGTATVIEVAVTAVGVALVPLKETEVLAVVPNPVPDIVTIVPAGPALGETLAATSVLAECRVTDNTFPAAS